MPEVSGQAQRIHTVVHELEAATVPQEMRMDAIQSRAASCFLEDLIERVARHRPTQAGEKHKPRTDRLTAAQLAQPAKRAATERLHTVIRSLEPFLELPAQPPPRITTAPALPTPP